MSNIRLTKNELRSQQHKLNQLSRYLPTLQLKKAMLQMEVNTSLQVLAQLEKEFDKIKAECMHFASLLNQGGLQPLLDGLNIKEIKTSVENIAGVEIPLFESITFDDANYPLYNTPVWWDSALVKLREMLERREKIRFARKKTELLQEELRSVSIRVNLFEKILIPRTAQNIKKIKVFLGDQQLSAVATSKVAKLKLESKKKKKGQGERI